MKVFTVPVGGLATNCHIAVDFEAGECIVIDPGAEGERIMETVSAHGATVRAIVLTHGHFDHTGAAGYVQSVTGAPVFVGEADSELLKDPGWMLPFVTKEGPDVGNLTVLREGDTVSFGGVSLQVIETPGHSRGSISLYCPGHLFSGDLLFHKGVGRTDLPGGNLSQLLSSIREKVLTLPESTAVHAGHGKATTVGYEKANNPFL